MTGLSSCFDDTPQAPRAQSTGARPKVRSPPTATVSPTQAIEDTPDPRQQDNSATEFYSAQSQVVIYLIPVSPFLHAMKVSESVPLSLCFVITLAAASFTSGQCNYKAVGWYTISRSFPLTHANV